MKRIKSKLKKKKDMARDRDVMRRQRFYMDIAIRCAELAACDIDIKDKGYKIGRKDGMNEIIRIFHKHYGKK